MDVRRPVKGFEKIKATLVFFFLVSCASNNGSNLELVSDHGKVVAVRAAFEGRSDSIWFGLKGSKTPILGSLEQRQGSFEFRPLVPFTEGLDYEAHIGAKGIVFHIPVKKEGNGPKLMAVYPTQDTVPENLLKVYLKFSEPMQYVGEALDFITVTEVGSDVELDVFLPLESELWDKNHTLLTLWLDPGRIKTDLIPNRKLGLPLESGKTYQVAIDGRWRNAKGDALGEKFVRVWTVATRDMHNPKVEDWHVRAPRKGTQEALEITFGEPLDAQLLLESFEVGRAGGKAPLDVAVALLENERGIRLVPELEWQSGTYEIQVDARLEDLAGNNLNRLFDTDLQKTTDRPQDDRTHTILFEVQ